MKTKSKLSAGVAALALSLASQASLAQEVELSNQDRSLMLKGELLKFENDIYTIQTAYGVFNLPATEVTCSGDNCPSAVVDFTNDIIATDAVSRSVAEALLTGIASKNQLEARINEGPNGLTYEFYDLSGESRGKVSITEQPLDAATDTLLAGSTGVVISARGLSQNRIAAINESGGPDFSSSENERIVALDAFVPVVNPRNSVGVLSIDDFADIASGRIENWSELGGPDAKIRLILPQEGTEEYAYLRDFLIQPYRLRMRGDIEWQPDVDAILDAVRADENAITFASISNSGDTKILPMQRVCGMLAFPSDFAVKSEEYPFTRRVRLYTNDRGYSAGLNQLLDYATSVESQSVLQLSGVQGQSITRVPISEQGDRLVGALNFSPDQGEVQRLQEFVDEVAVASRLSATFRFVSGSSRLDTKATQDLDTVANYLAEQGRGVREIVIMGFTDDVGRNDVNIGLALSRANTVRDALLAASRGRIDPDKVSVKSYGPLAPVDCNDTVEGRSSNRRVEIWLR